MSNELSASCRKRRSLSIASRSARPRRRCSAMCATPSTGRAMQSARMTRAITIAAKFSWSPARRHQCGSAGPIVPTTGLTFRRKNRFAGRILNGIEAIGPPGGGLAARTGFRPIVRGERTGHGRRSLRRNRSMPTLSGVDEVLKAAVARSDVPGVVAMAASRDGAIYQGAFGRRVLPSGAAMTVDTVFWIASMTKAITSTAAMQLVERGKLSLDRPIAELLPELVSPQVLEGFDASGEPRLRPAARPITLRHLITHTAGFTYEIWNPEMGRYMEKARRTGDHLLPERGSQSAARLRSR